jgi:hypothetical protein
MLQRIREILVESRWLLSNVIGYDIGVEVALSRLEAALDDLDASTDPLDSQVEIVFKTLANLQEHLLQAMPTVPKPYQVLIENLTDRIDIFLFHHRLI